MVGLSQVRTRVVGEFSKGMQRRIGLAQALINDPELVILDEPTAGMDPIGCREVKDLILALARRGKTVILSSHLLSDVEDVCDRVVIYYGGRIQAMGTLEGIAGQTRRRPHHHAALVARNDAAGAGRSSGATSRRARSRWKPRPRTWKVIFWKSCAKPGKACPKLPARLPAAAWPPISAATPKRPRRRIRILERLTVPTAPKPAAPAAPAAPPPRIDEAKLEGPGQTRRAAPARRRARPAPPVDLGKANEKLSALLGKKTMNPNSAPLRIADCGLRISDHSSLFCPLFVPFRPISPIPPAPSPT